MYLPHYECLFTTPEGEAWITTWGSCAADAGSRAIRLMDAQRGDRAALLDNVYPEGGFRRCGRESHTLGREKVTA